MISARRFTLSLAACLACLQFAPSAASAAVILQATRVIFPASASEASLLVRNDGEDEALIQSWMAADGSDADVPFALAPALARIPGGGTQLLRVLYEGSGLPTDRESVARLHVQDVPRAIDGDNVLQFAVRHAIKVFYRPKGLPGEPADAPGTLRWRLLQQAAGASLVVENPSAYHVSIVNLDLRTAGKDTQVTDSTMIAPFSEARFALAAPAAPDAGLRFISINDYGGSDAFEVALQEDTPATARPAVRREP